MSAKLSDSQYEVSNEVILDNMIKTATEKQDSGKKSIKWKEFNTNNKTKIQTKNRKKSDQRLEQNPIILSFICTDENCHVSLNVKYILIKRLQK